MTLMPKAKSKLAIDICDDSGAINFDEDLLRQAAQAILSDAGVKSGSLSIAVVGWPPCCCATSMTFSFFATPMRAQKSRTASGV